MKGEYLMYTYNELVEKIQKQEPVSFKEISGVQVFMLLHDRVVKSVNNYNTIYELNFLPIEYSVKETIIYINEKTCPTYSSCGRIIDSIINQFKKHLPIYVELEDELYEIIVEVLVSNE